MKKYFLNLTREAYVKTRGTGPVGRTAVESIYANGVLSEGWQDYSYNGKTNLKSTSCIPKYDGDSFSAEGVYTNWGKTFYFIFFSFF